ncbi:MAG: porin, partial [Rubrivivax sp.]|nr:porin [Rubrivivax sp.]
MNKTLIVAALSALAAGSALAQSSVTLYGRVNVTVERQDADGKKTSQMVNNASRIGFKGTEDLGGGLKAGFQLEHGFNIDTGAAGSPFWGRQAEVNLSGGFGAVRLGNFISEAYFATADYISMHNHDTGPSSDALYAYVGRNGNKIAYRAPTFVKGLSIEGAVSAGEGAANTTRSYDFAVNYELGKLALGLGAERNNAKEQFAARALYDFGAVVVGGYVQRDKEGYNPVAGAKTFGNRTTYRLTAMVP